MSNETIYPRLLRIVKVPCFKLFWTVSDFHLVSCFFFEKLFISYSKVFSSCSKFLKRFLIFNNLFLESILKIIIDVNCEENCTQLYTTCSNFNIIIIIT